jgi:phospholipid-binding lipoprotein MlaA
MKRLARCLSSLLICCAVLTLAACRTTPATAINPNDPFQHINEDAFRFNDKLDKAFIKPLAEGYQAVLPKFIRIGISNFFDNLYQPETMGQDVLQGNVGWFLSDTWRFVINTTVGIGGLFDVAKHIGLPQHSNDFGLTLNTYHIYTPYLVVPLLGPRTVGNTIGIGVDYYIGIQRFVIPTQYTIEMTALYGLNTRAQLLSAEKTASGLMLNPYAFMRNAYLQNRAYLLKVNKEDPPSWRKKSQDDDEGQWVD